MKKADKENRNRWGRNERQGAAGGGVKRMGGWRLLQMSCASSSRLTNQIKFNTSPNQIESLTQLTTHQIAGS